MHILSNFLGQGPPLWDHWRLYPGANWCELLPGGVGAAGVPGKVLRWRIPSPDPHTWCHTLERSSSLSIPKQLVFPGRKSHLGAAAALSAVPYFRRVYQTNVQVQTSSSHRLKQQRIFPTTLHLILQDGF